MVAVSKTATIEAIETAYAMGQRCFGENRAQELVRKAAALPSDIQWHMIGAVQTNKVRILSDVVERWHTIDRDALVLEIAKRSPGARVLLEVNVAREAQKAGCDPDQVAGLLNIATSAGLRVEGLMCIPPAGPDSAACFGLLRDIAAELQLRDLSMGMTNDFETAIACGATVVRVGTAIFGPRPSVAPARN